MSYPGGNVRGGIVRGEMSGGNVRVWEMSWGKCPGEMFGYGKCPGGNVRTPYFIGDDSKN